MSIQRKKRPVAARGKWWRKQPSAGHGVNRRTYRAVGHINPHAATGPSLLLQRMMGDGYQNDFQAAMHAYWLRDQLHS